MDGNIFSASFDLSIYYMTIAKVVHHGRCSTINENNLIYSWGNSEVATKYCISTFLLTAKASTMKWSCWINLNSPQLLTASRFIRWPAISIQAALYWHFRRHVLHEKRFTSMQENHCTMSSRWQTRSTVGRNGLN